MTMVQDIDRPDVNGVAPKMQAIGDRVSKALLGACPVLRVNTNDNIMSSVWIKGAMDERDQWANGIFENGLYFSIAITPVKGTRYYVEGERVTLYLSHCSHKLPNAKLRKYTATPDKVIAKLAAWIESQRV